MELRNKTASVINYQGKAYGPGQVIPFTDEDAGNKATVAMISNGQLEPTLGKKAPSEGLTVEQLKAALDEKGVAYEAGANKKTLAALLDAATA